MKKNEMELQGNMASLKNKKRWESPRLTRLDFPKTASGGAHNSSHDSVYNLS